MSDDHLNLALAEGGADGDTRWAFGTGFEDPLHGVDTGVPDGVDAAGLSAYCLALGDDALVSAQRLAQWCTRAPELEEELALANIGLDLLGQARLLYSRAGQADGTGRDEDHFAYFRDASQFRNVRLTELPLGDFAFSIARLLVLSTCRLAVFQALTAAGDPVLAAVAAKGVKELTYHRQFAAEWVVRLGDGTEESHRRAQTALTQVVPWVGELFDDQSGVPFGVSMETVEAETRQVLAEVTDAAGLVLPEVVTPSGSGRTGEHTEHLVPLLEELQSVARAHPEGTW